MVDLLTSFVKPIIDSYSVTFDSVSEAILGGETEVSVQQFEGRIFSALHRMAKEGLIESFESSSMIFIKNALRTLQVSSLAPRLHEVRRAL